ncbi:preprotein translocase subunit SecE [Sphingomonas sp. SCN 67-18]|uniref:preprotein translocase subunit SecE n=1 Tax=uncultured Sphingomonas sp. TaxID=158754 RepID=UPI000B14A742|nr:preprotein translocase subunit SecE [Sphingomonas sp. SCN 67-18]
MANSTSFIRNIPQFIQQVRTETSKVVWPTGRQTMMTTFMVIVMTSMLGLFFFVTDKIFSFIVHSLLSLAV